MIKFDEYCLRALEPYDLDALYFWENDLNSFTNHEMFFSRYTLEKYIEQAHLPLNEAKQMRFVISKTSEPDLCLGFIDVFDYDLVNKRLEIGILVDPKYRKLGLAKKGLYNLEKYLLTNFEIKQLYCYVETKNTISQSLFEGLSYLKVGTLKSWRKYKNNWQDVYIYQKLMG